MHTHITHNSKRKRLLRKKIRNNTICKRPSTYFLNYSNNNLNTVIKLFVQPDSYFQAINSLKLNKLIQIWQIYTKFTQHWPLWTVGVYLDGQKKNHWL